MESGLHVSQSPILQQKSQQTPGDDVIAVNHVIHLPALLVSAFIQCAWLRISIQGFLNYTCQPTSRVPEGEQRPPFIIVKFRKTSNCKNVYSFLMQIQREKILLENQRNWRKLIKNYKKVKFREMIY